MHVWVVESSENRKVAEQLWATGLRGMEVGGVTTFGKGSTAGAEKLCLDVIESIDLHHYYHDPPYSVLEVVGARLSPPLQEWQVRLYEVHGNARGLSCEQVTSGWLEGRVDVIAAVAT
jgi:hypothetical protein